MDEDAWQPEAGETSVREPDASAAQDAWETTTPPATRLVVQLALAAVAVLLLAWLAYLLGLSPQRLADHPVGGWWGRGAWTVIVVSSLVAILAAEVLLLDSVRDRLHRVPRGLPITPDQDNYIVGCPGCGTVFTVVEAELERGSFACHNCGRPGYVKDHHLNPSAVKQERCATCGNTYLEYMEHSECPVCHNHNG